MGETFSILSSSTSAPAPAPGPQPLLESDWRKVDWENKEALLKKMRAYDRGDEDVKHIRIMLYGPVGAGKSSFVNSVTSCLRGRMAHGAAVDALGGTSYTVKYKTHTIKQGNTKKLGTFPLVFNDIMGLEEKSGIKEKDLELAMQGHIKDGYTFNSVASISAKDPFYNPEPAPEDKVHVLVCVVPADKVTILSKEFTDKIREIRLAARDLGIPQLCIITKIDTVHELMAEDVRNTYKMKIVKEKMEEFSNQVGIPMTCIFPVKNYHDETEPHNDIDVLTLKAMEHMINLGEDFIDEM